jgi:solute carrier family 40 (iron-regulated transporter), member 1
VQIERDFVTTIADGSARRLTRLNAYMRRIDLLSKLVAPLFVSALTAASYQISAVVLLAICGATLLFELLFIPIVFNRFGALQTNEKAAQARLEEERTISAQQGDQILPFSPSRFPQLVSKMMVRWARHFIHDWSDFAAMPVFISECLALCQIHKNLSQHLCRYYQS